MKRLIAVINSTSADGPVYAQAKVYRDTEWNEFRVRYYQGEDGLVHYLGEASDSHHDDKDDAMRTAQTQVRRLATTAEK